jgi:GNAT superfamily N-acetyltransferase
MGSDTNHRLDQAAVEYIVTNSKELFKYFGNSSQCELLYSNNYQGFITDIPHPMVNGIFDAQLTSELIEEGIENIIDLYQENHVPFEWYVWPTSTPADLSKHLLANNFSHSHNMPSMLADLAALPTEVPIPANVRLERISSEVLLLDWMVPFKAGYQMPEIFNDYFFALWKEFGFSNELPVQHYLAYIGDKPAACVTLYLGENNIAGIWNVATSPEARGKGIGTAITWKACYEALQKKYQYAILLASKMGYNIYKNLGFKEYFETQVYIWQPSENE